MVGVEIDVNSVFTEWNDTSVWKVQVHLHIECHTEQSRSTWHAGLSALLVLLMDLARVLLVIRFGIPDPNARRNPQAVEMAADLVLEVSKQHSDVVQPSWTSLGNILNNVL